MRSDIDRLMAEANLDAMIILGDSAPNPYRDYMTRRSKATGVVVKKRDQEAVFITPSGMELAEAAKSGLTVRPMFDFTTDAINEKYKDDPAGRQLATYENLFRQLGIKGRVAFYGVADVSRTLELVTQLNVPEVEIVVGSSARDVFSRAYETKDAEEIGCLKEAAQLTCEVVRRTWDFIGQHYAQNDSVGSQVVNANGEPLTIGAVKSFIRMQECELGLDDPETCIFAQGADAGYPHSHGEDGDVLLVGKSIVFDIFPRGLESGYFHDMTRTWCLGQAPRDVQSVYDDVMTVFQKAKDALKVGEDASLYQTLTLDYFESKGYATHRSKPGTLEGYVHSLGHGLGLNIHESPFLATNRIGSVLQAGNVFTVEPGLYYPERGFGVRIEDTVYFDASGKLHTLTNFPYNLVLPLSKRR